MKEPECVLCGEEYLILGRSGRRFAQHSCRKYIGFELDYSFNFNSGFYSTKELALAAIPKSFLKGETDESDN